MRDDCFRVLWANGEFDAMFFLGDALADWRHIKHKVDLSISGGVAVGHKLACQVDRIPIG